MTIGENRELELKFEVDPASTEALIAHLGPGAAPGVRRLKSIYFDTADQALRKADFTLWVRKEGRRWTQTVKSCAASSGAGRGEWEAAVDGFSPDPELVRDTPAAGILDGSALEPLFTVSVERRSMMSTEAGSTVEVSLDKGEATRTCHSVAFRELELELKSGEPAALFAFAGRLRKAFALRPGFTTKADRGFALMNQKSPPGRHFRPPALEREMTAGAAFKAIALAALEQIAGNAEDLRERPNAEVIHQMRVGARRLQSTLSTFNPIVTDRCLGQVKDQLHWVLGELDAARNLDVFLSGAFARASHARSETSESADLAALGKRLRLTRKAAYARARTAAEGDRFSELLLDILTWIEVGPWTEQRGDAAVLRDAPISEFAATALEKAWRRARRQARRFDHLDREGRHKLRIRAKTLRYGADVVDGFFKAHPKRAGRFVGRVEILLGRLGELNDIATGEVLVADTPAPKCLTDREASLERRLIGSARRAADTFGEAKRFWPKRA
jgi:inorganic triphosphatase YgiF